MTEVEFQTARATAFLLAAGVAMGLERVAPHARYRGDIGVNLGLWALNLVVMGVVCGACAAVVSAWAAGQGVGLLNGVALPFGAQVLVGIVGLDIVSYAWHRMNHRFPALWRFHQVHHSDSTFTVTTGVRFHPGELVLSLPVRLAAVVVLGAPVEAVLAFEAVFAVANLVEHGDIDLPARLERALGRALVTPALHRRHHVRSARDRDVNFGTIFALWDRALGTYRPSDSAARFETGLPGLARRPRLGEALLMPLSRLG
jgi:sterol desaturase/sphingolipid hydroxylase (fatty acid hydroxylase superfamily)